MAAQRQLANALKKAHKEPIEGFCVELLNDDDLFQWRIYLEGPSESPYEGGIFQAVMKFPPEYPMLPPSLTFSSDFWHPNVYPDGKVCISILHPPGEDAMSGELPEERWLPTQTVGTVLLSVISMLNDPNTSSPANVDASVMWRNDREAYNKKCAELVKKANKELPEDVVIPHPDTNPEEKQRALEKMKQEEEPVDFFDDGDEFFQEDSEEDGEVNPAFYDTDDSELVDEAEIWKENSDIEQSDSESVDEDSVKEEIPEVKSTSVEEKLLEEKVEEIKEQNTVEVKEELHIVEEKKEESESLPEKKEDIVKPATENKASVDADKKKKKDCIIM